MRINADTTYQELVHVVVWHGERVCTRNAETLRVFDAKPIRFTQTPLVTLRKTAWKMALREMQWFLSGDTKCPEVLLPWWQGQLSPNGHYYGGYGHQWRHWRNSFDQIESLIDGLRKHPTSRRHMLTTWDAESMANIIDTNKNPQTPTCCHSTIIQFFVSRTRLHATSYQRSADLLLGVPHNWIQSWALLHWLAHQTGLTAKSLRWIFGDLHIYREHSHLECTDALLAATPPDSSVELPELIYTATERKEFQADDFIMKGAIPGPQVTIRPKLL